MMGYAIEMFDLAKSADNPQVLFMARRAAGYANFLLGDLAKAREDLEALISSYDVERDGPPVGDKAGQGAAFRAIDRVLRYCASHQTN